ncbi:pentapeptide repeat-containing protein [Bradyrhizobium liaoningense]|uniref:pentapeptide repeat-containing protein n=1 Tax=Bradyrhizobium liaoningense TaxID=43992 RepID=UPI001BA9F3B8|nr:pentapeptide repeat-containing protein [Bradyrhizobium liaoningense]MBR1171804.1 pentapeptide repeat-containing protein [Bradyrhizobium liaoningense]
MSTIGEQTQEAMLVTGEPLDKPTAAVRPAQSIVALCITFLLIGAPLGPALYFLTAGVERYSASIFPFVVGFFVAAALAVAVATLASVFILPRLFKNAAGTLTGITAELNKATNAYYEGDSKVAVQHLGQAAENTAAWYSAVSVRRFASQSAIALVIALGGTVGSVLLLTQNTLLRGQTELLREQNEKLDQQTFTAEAQRRASLTAALFDALRDVASEKPREDRGKISEGLTARLAALSRSAQPYLFVQTDRQFIGGKFKYFPRLIKRPLSPERGQLLIGLVTAGVDLQALDEAGLSFAGADLRKAALPSANLSGLDFEGADFSEADLRKTSFVNADVSSAQFDHADARDADFTKARIDSTNFTSATLSYAKFIQATMTDVTFDYALIAFTDFSSVKSFNGDFHRARVGEDLNVDRKSGFVHQGYPVGLPRPPSRFKVVPDGPFLWLEDVKGGPKENPNE